MNVAKLSKLNAGITPRGYTLVETEHRLELRSVSDPRSRPLFVDFVGGSTGFRRMSGQSRKQPLARAVGIKGEAPFVIDATAGMGRDSFLLACLGCRVLMIERSPVLGALLADGLSRAAGHSAVLDRILARLDLRLGDARAIFATLAPSDRPDVVYLDPMYTPSQRTALSKKELRVCRDLVGDDPDAEELFIIARRMAAKRLVVKRHPDAHPLARDPDMSYVGRTTRYDAYLRASSSSGSGI